jgi:hypothetical protein
MQSTHRYLDPSTLAGTDPAAALRFLARQDRWDRRLETLEADRGDEAAERAPASERALAR